MAMVLKGASKLRKVVLALILALGVGVFGLGAYLLNYSHPQEHALGCVSGEVGNAAVQLDSGIAFLPSKDKDLHVGLILYPGGKVSYKAYAPIAQACAERGITCIVAKMPANLAFLDQDAASGLMPQFSGVKRWYVGGHSLGGVAASSYAADHADDLKGVVLLASYSTQDLTDADLDVLSVRGSLDGILNERKYWEQRANISSPRLTEVMIDGANHSQFGCYGLQKGDGSPGISEEEQIRQTVNAIEELVKSGLGQSSAA